MQSNGITTHAGQMMDRVHYADAVWIPAGRRRSVTRSLMSPLGRLVGCLVSAQRRRRDYRELLLKPDYLLDDVGVSRGEIIAEIERSVF